MVVIIISYKYNKETYTNTANCELFSAYCELDKPTIILTRIMDLATVFMQNKSPYIPNTGSSLPIKVQILKQI